MEFNIQDQLIKGMEFGTLVINVSSETLISSVTINTILFGVSYYNGVLTINQPLLIESSESSSIPTEAYIDENKILKLR